MDRRRRIACMRIEAWGKTDIGLRRESNQDSILVDKDLGLFIVADGMGGHKGGEVASAIAVETLHEMVSEQAEKTASVSPSTFLVQAYEEASVRIHHVSSFERPELMGMGTTLVVGLIWKQTMYIANVGDSRAYLFHGSHLWQLTEDHSLVHEQKKAGLINEDYNHLAVGKNIITRSVGFEKDIMVDIVERKFCGDEMFLFCSDGLTGMVSDRKIEEILTENTPNQAVPICVEEAKKGGGEDNISVVLLSVKRD